MSSRRRLLRCLEERRRREAELLRTTFPDDGPYRRELYPAHMRVVELTATRVETCMMAGNRVGKTRLGALMTACHATGLYPHWWNGHRWDRPIRGWYCGKKWDKVREIGQTELLGGKNREGMIPGRLVDGRPTLRGGVRGLVDTIAVRHVSGGVSELQSKSYAEGRDGFEGERIDWIWNDEEPPLDVYEEEMLRLMDTDGAGPGRLLNTFTPLEGLSEVVMLYLPDGGQSIREAFERRAA